MKYFLAILLAASVTTTTAAPVIKRVCHDVTVKGKVVKQCKNIKVHKKVNGTKVPEKAPAQPVRKNK